MMAELDVKVERLPFGVITENGFQAEVDKFKITGSQKPGGRAALVATVCPFGANLLSLLVPDRQGRLDDVALGFDTLSEYQLQDSYIGATIGRNASRIAGSAFTLDGVTYKLAANSGGSHLHGGIRGFDKRLFAAEVGQDSVTFTYRSPNTEEGYPGDVMVQVTYRVMLYEGLPSLSIQYHGLSGSPTPLNMTNHSYFNLAGHKSGEAGLREHHVHIMAKKKLILEGGFANGELTNASPEADEPTGPLPEVMRANGGEIDDVFILPSENKPALKTAALLTHPVSGRRMTVVTNQPAVVVYTANHFPPAPGGMAGRAGAMYQKHGSIALETSGFPNAMNVPSFPQVTLRPGQMYDHRCIYQFGGGSAEPHHVVYTY